MYYIVGLGNPGERYTETRHNAGQIMLKQFVAAVGLPDWHTSSALNGQVSEGVVRGQEVTCLLPQTYMNHSGRSVAKLVAKGAAERLIVLYDDVDLPLGTIKLSFGRGDGGHNGVASIISSLGTKDFIRLRIGVAQKTVWPWERGEVRRPRGDRMGDFVLAPFTKKEHQELEALVPTVTAALVDLLVEGREAAMNRFN